MLSALLIQVKTDVTELLLQKLEHVEITPERAAAIAQFVLAALPNDLTDEQVMHVIPQLDDEFYELAGIVHKYLKTYEEANREKTITEAEQLIHQGKLDQAHQRMKNYFQKKLA